MGRRKKNKREEKQSDGLRIAIQSREDMSPMKALA
jgi:hypothetical protein